MLKSLAERDDMRMSKRARRKRMNERAGQKGRKKKNQRGDYYLCSGKLFLFFLFFFLSSYLSMDMAHRERILAVQSSTSRDTHESQRTSPRAQFPPFICQDRKNIQRTGTIKNNTPETFLQSGRESRKKSSQKREKIAKKIAN